MPPLKGLKGNKSLIIIKKKRYMVAGGGHGSSAWKIAYADFVTAMMAFFLLMWLVNSMSHEAERGTYQYFDPLNVSDASSGAGGLLGGETITSDGAMQDVTATPGEPGPPKMTVEEEQKEFEEVVEKIKESLAAHPEMEELAKSLVMEITPEGLKIQIVDQFKKPMFPKGSSMLYYDAQQLLATVVKSIKDLPQKLVITGHTDTSPYRGTGYSNWDLSTDRANAVRRFLAKTLSSDRFFEVAGKADAEPFNADDPLHPSNRRISLMLKSIAAHPPAGGKASPSKTQGPEQSRKPEKPQGPKFFQIEEGQGLPLQGKPPESKKPAKAPQKAPQE